uniref:Uncharacterized protein n=1 Tax=Meloidogyne enterolobii TaxID=390850 RepID=A0A6V7TW58_MELEN|nr:unnamed protein product [Meloidogyne enterolobii]
MMPLMTITTASTPSMVSSNKIFQRLTPRTRLSAVEMMAEEEALLGEGMESMENNGIIKFIFFSEQQHRIRTKSPLSGSNRNYGSLERRQQCSTSETVDYVTSPPNHSSYDIDFKGQSNNTSEHFGAKKTKLKNYDKIYDKIYGKIYNKFYDKSDDKNDENTQNDNKKEENLTNIPAALIVGRREISTQTEAVRRRLQQRRQSRYKRLTGSDESKEAGRSGSMEKDEEVEDEEEKEKREEDRRKKMRERMKEAEGEEEIKKRLEEGRMKDLNKGKTKEERRMNKPFALKIENGDEEEEEESDEEGNGRKEEREGREDEQSEDLPYSEEELSVDFRRGLGDSEEEDEEENEKELSSDDRIEYKNNKDNLERREKNDQMIVRC